MRIVIVAMVAVLALSFVSLAAVEVGAPAGATTDTKVAPLPNPDVALAYGKLTKIDGKSLTIAVKERGSEVTKDVVIMIGDTTKVFTREMAKESKPVPAKVEDLKVDQSVRAEYNKTTNVISGITIHVKPANVPATPTTPVAPAK